MSEFRKRAALFKTIANYDEALKGGLHEAGILARLFIMIMQKAGIDLLKLSELLLLYSSEMQSKQTGSTDKNSAKGNLVKELGKKTMTWKVFLKGLRFLRVVRLKLSVTVYWTSREPTTVELKTILRRGPCVGDSENGDYEQPATVYKPGAIPEQHQSPTAQALVKQLDEALRKASQTDGER